MLSESARLVGADSSQPFCGVPSSAALNCPNAPTDWARHRQRSRKLAVIAQARQGRPEHRPSSRSYGQNRIPTTMQPQGNQARCRRLSIFQVRRPDAYSRRATKKLRHADLLLS